MARYVNIHSHQLNDKSVNCIELTNIMLHEEDILLNQIISAGWHPWFIEGHSQNEISLKLNYTLNAPNVVAIGECGLDRAIDIDFASQIQVFNLHLKYSIELQKPLIIHCVKAYSDLLSILKKEKYQGKIILHDFRGNLQQLKELQKFNTWYSFGKSLFRNNPKLIQVFQTIPISTLFLETDNPTYQIENIYIRAAELLNIDLEVLKYQLESNFKAVFGDGVA